MVGILELSGWMMNMSKASLQFSQDLCYEAWRCSTFLSPQKECCSCLHVFSRYDYGWGLLWPCMSLYVNILDIAGLGHVLAILWASLTKACHTAKRGWQKSLWVSPPLDHSVAAKQFPYRWVGFVLRLFFSTNPHPLLHSLPLRGGRQDPAPHPHGISFVDSTAFVQQCVYNHFPLASPRICVDLWKMPGASPLWIDSANKHSCWVAVQLKSILKG